MSYSSYCTNIPISGDITHRLVTFSHCLGNWGPEKASGFHRLCTSNQSRGLPQASVPHQLPRLEIISPRLLVASFFPSSLLANYLGKQMLLHFFGVNCALGGHADTFSMSLLKVLVSPLWEGALIKCTCAWTYEWFWEPESKIQWMLWTEFNFAMSKEKLPAAWICLRCLQNTRTVRPVIQDQDWKWLLQHHT